MIERDRDDQASESETPETTTRPNPAYDPEQHANEESDVYPFEIENPGWDIVGVARKDGDDEQVFDLQRSDIVWREIDDASQLDPPKSVPSKRPRRRT